MYTAIICAAGAGTRMGMPKALCRLGDCTFLQNILHTLVRADIQRAIVMVGAEAEKIIALHRESDKTPTQIDIAFYVSPNWRDEHMLETLTAGISKIHCESGVIHWPVDCVHIHADDLRKLVFCGDEPLRALAWNHTPEHPMRMTPQAVSHFLHHHYHSLRDFVEELGVTPVEAQHPALLNCNTQAQLQSFVHQYGDGSGLEPHRGERV